MPADSHFSTGSPDARLPLFVIERAAGMLRAAGDPVRLRVLELLLDGERHVSEIAALTESEMSATSQRLRILLQESLVVRRRDGKSVLYRLADEHVRTLIQNVLDHADPEKSI